MIWGRRAIGGPTLGKTNLWTGCVNSSLDKLSEGSESDTFNVSMSDGANGLPLLMASCAFFPSSW